eukprot:5185023-Ditylum_brightwellii.AAC.1
MGKGWNITTMRIKNLKMKHHTSALISKLHKIDDLTPKELTKLESIINLTHGDGYFTLYNLH